MVDGMWRGVFECGDVPGAAYVVKISGNVLIAAALEAMGEVVAMAEKSGVGVVLEETKIPVRDEVRAASELLGIDPLHAANEGKVVMGVKAEAVDAVLAALRAHPLGRNAQVVGVCVAERPGFVILDTGFGRRLVTEPEGELLPRIC